ncbi:NAD(P)-binding domain-containing protein [Thermosulfuriphilus sp.]
MEQVSLVIVGAGPAGIAAACEAKAAGIDKVVVLEKAPHLCDTIVRLYHEGKRVDPVFLKRKVEPIGLLSFDTESKEEFLERMKGFVEKYDLDIRYKSEVTKIEKEGDRFVIWVNSQKAFEAPVVVVAIGVFGRPVKPSYPIPKEVKDKVFFGMPLSCPEGQKILVVGGGDTAAETACFLCEKNEVYLSYRRPQFFRINEENMCALEDKCKEGRVNLMMATDIEGLEPAEGGVKVNFKDGNSMIFDAVYYCLGGSTPEAFLQAIGVELDGKRPKVAPDGESNIPGLFLVGDLVAEKGTIMAAFNSAKTTIEAIASKYGDRLKA